MKKSPSVHELEREKKTLLESLCPADFPDTENRPAVLEQLDAGFVKSLLTGLALHAEGAGYCLESQGFTTEIVQASEEIHQACLQEKIELLRDVAKTGTDQVRRTAYGMLIAVFPVRARGKIIHCLTTGNLLVQPLTDKDIEKYAGAARLSADEVRKRAACIPVRTDVEIEQILSLFRKHRDSIEQALAHYVKSRELANQLVESERTRSLGTLSGGVAHHFNNLLSVILGYSSFVLNRETLSKEATDALQKITDAAQRGRRLTEELLAFAGSEVEEERVCHVHDTITNVLSLLSSQTPSKIRTQAILAAEKDDVLSPPSCIHQIIFNLLTNALDSMSEGGELTITTSNVETDSEEGLQQSLRVEVADSSGVVPAGFEGIEGVPSAENFEPGDRMGLKLSSVYGIVGRLEGNVLISSQPGAMTRVEIVLPISTQGRGAPAPKRKKKRLAPSTIWVVDDDPTFREMCEIVLAEDGHTAEGIPGGKEMQEKWQAASTPPDLIIIDFSMPEYNGLELRQWLAKQGATVPIILVSGLSVDQPDIHKALDMKKTFFLQKPFSFREMADVVTVAMGETLLGE